MTVGLEGVRLATSSAARSGSHSSALNLASPVESEDGDHVVLVGPGEGQDLLEGVPVGGEVLVAEGAA